MEPNGTSIRCCAIAYIIVLDEVSCSEKTSSEISTCSVNVDFLHQMLSPLQEATSASLITSLSLESLLTW